MVLRPPSQEVPWGFLETLPGGSLRVPGTAKSRGSLVVPGTAQPGDPWRVPEAGWAVPNFLGAPGTAQPRDFLGVPGTSQPGCSLEVLRSHSQVPWRFPGAVQLENLGIPGDPARRSQPGGSLMVSGTAQPGDSLGLLGTPRQEVSRMFLRPVIFKVNFGFTNFWVKN